MRSWRVLERDDFLRIVIPAHPLVEHVLFAKPVPTFAGHALSAGRGRRRSSAPPSFSQLHNNRATGEYATERLADRQRRAAGQGCCYCRPQRRPLVFRGSRTLITDQRLPENFPVSLEAQSNGNLRRCSHFWRDPARAQTCANLADRVERMLGLRRLCWGTGQGNAADEGQHRDCRVIPGNRRSRFRVHPKRSSVSQFALTLNAGARKPQWVVRAMLRRTRIRRMKVNKLHVLRHAVRYCFKSDHECGRDLF